MRRVPVREFQGSLVPAPFVGDNRVEYIDPTIRGIAMTTSAATPEGSLLLTLEEVSRLVSHSRDPSETLQNIVRLIQGRCHSAVCSVYFLEPAGNELVLAATVGLKAESVGRVRMRINEGLTGLVAEQMTPVMVADAFKHPRFKYFPEVGEDPYHSFLGVPLVEGGALQGVLVVQTFEPRTFSPSEVRMLVTVGAQLASLVADARLLAQVSAAAHARPSVSTATHLTGVPVSPGKGVGQAYVVDGFEEWRQNVPGLSDDPARERRRLREAMVLAREEIDRLSLRISELVGEDHGAILQAQLMIMQDRTLEKDLDDCLHGGSSAEAALLTTLDKYVAAFQKVSTPFFQERVYDIKDVFHRLLWQLRERQAPGANADRLVLVAREASVLELFAVDLDRLAGIVVEHGGPQSHAAILARSLGIPMVGQATDFADLQRPGRRLLVDGTAGTVVLDPPLDLAIPGKKVADETSATITLPPGLPRLEVNVNLLWEADPAVRQGADGVGLYRSEFLFLARRTLPTEEEQVGIYRKLIQRLQGRPVTIRTFDLRPDKLAAYSHISSVAARPFDWRLAMESPPLQQLFRQQVRAVFRAGVLGPSRIMVPLVTRTELLDFIMDTVREARAALQEEGMAFASDVPVGIMIETAAAVPLASDWLPRVDFLALGTNDLTASALGIDRDDPESAGQADSLHPGLLRLIDGMATAARLAEKPLSVCGELAADPLGAVALAILGVDSLSVPVNSLASIRRILAGLNHSALMAKRVDLVRQTTSKGVRELLQVLGDAGAE